MAILPNRRRRSPWRTKQLDSSTKSKELRLVPPAPLAQAAVNAHNAAELWARCPRIFATLARPRGRQVPISTPTVAGASW